MQTTTHKYIHHYNKLMPVQPFWLEALWAQVKVRGFMPVAHPEFVFATKEHLV